MYATEPLGQSDFVRCVEALAQQPDATALLEMLQERNSIYEEQNARTIVQMRGWILAALSRHELPDAALPFVLEELDTSREPYLVGAAAMALRAYRRPRAEFASFILRALKDIRAHDQPLSFAGYGDYARSTDAPTAVHELLTTAKWLGPHGSVLAPELLKLKQSGALPHQAQDDLDSVLRAIGPTSEEVKNEECCSFALHLSRASWPFSKRQDSAGIESVVFEDQHGTVTTYGEFFKGAPTIVVFFYTRCDNPLKCSLSIWKLANVQKLLESRGVAKRIRTAAITYDPDFDVPKRLLTFGSNRGLRMDANNRLLRATQGLAPLRSHFVLGVSFAAGLVSRHRIELFLLDSQGRVARSFERLHWNEGQVVDESVALLSESADARGRRNVSDTIAAAGPLSATVMACLPKCPLCWSAYMSSAGLLVVTPEAYPRMLQLVVVSLLVHLASVYWRARTTGYWLGLALSLGGTVILISSIWFGMGVPAVGSMLVAAGALANALRPRLVKPFL